MSPSLLYWFLAPMVVISALLVHAMADLPARSIWGASAALALVLGGTAGMLVQSRARLASGLGLLAVGLATWAWTGWVAGNHMGSRLLPEWEGMPLRVQATIDELPTRTSAEGYRFTARVEQCTVLADARPCTLTRVMLSWHERRAKSRPWTPVPDLQPGQRWSWVVKLKRPHAPHNPGAFDRELRFLQERLDAVGSVQEGSLLLARVPGWGLTIERFRSTIRDRMIQALEPSATAAAGVMTALAIGDQAAIPPDLWRVFNRTGVGHLMSISGLHITMLAAMAGAAARWLWRRSWVARWGGPCWVPTPWVRGGAAVSAAWIYALLAGWGIPAQRTCWMLTVAVVLVTLGRANAIGTTLGCAAVMVTWFDPWAPMASGFWLSFGAVVAIVWAGMGERFDQSARQRFWRQAVSTQWAATLALLPLGAWFFGSTSLIGPLANALAIPLVSGLIAPMAVLGGAVTLVWADAAAWILRPAAWLTNGLLWALEAVSAWSWASWPMARPSLMAVICACFGGFWLLAPRGLPGRRWGGLAMVPLMWAPSSRPGPDELWVTALDVGQGTAVVVQVADRVLVYDTGPTGTSGMDSGARVLVPWLQSQGIGHLDAVVISHQDDDHVGGAQSLLAAMSPDWLASSLPTDHAVLGGVGRHYPCRRGEHWQWGGAKFEWLHPSRVRDPGRGSPTNAVSCVLRIQSPAGTVLLTGDIEAAQERQLVALDGPAKLRAEVLVVPHHGSKTSSTEAFLDAVNPRWAVFQAAYRSRYGHPHPSVWARYQHRGITLLRSDADGAITVRLSPHAEVQVVRSRHDPRRYWRVPVVFAR